MRSRVSEAEDRAGEQGHGEQRLGERGRLVPCAGGHDRGDRDELKKAVEHQKVMKGVAKPPLAESSQRRVVAASSGAASSSSAAPPGVTRV